MKTNEITDGNRILAEFMTGRPKSSKVFFDLNCVASDLKYSTSWSWLMPVVEKIESLEDDFGGQRFNVQIEQCFCCIIENHTSQEIVDLDRDTKMEAVFAACVEFAKWYKKQ